MIILGKDMGNTAVIVNNLDLFPEPWKRKRFRDFIQPRTVLPETGSRIQKSAQGRQLTMLEVKQKKQQKNDCYGNNKLYYPHALVLP